MIWTPLLPPARPQKHLDLLPITVRATAAGRFKPYLIVTVRPKLLAGCSIDWWTCDASINVFVGNGASLGMLRLTPGGPWKLSGAQGKYVKQGKPNAASLRIREFPGMPPGGTARLAPEFDFDEDWIELTLPWAKPSAAKAPYKGLAARTGLTPSDGRSTRAIGGQA